jgi:hypothetical protein
VKISAEDPDNGASNVKVIENGDDDDGMWMKPSVGGSGDSSESEEEDIRSVADPWSVQLSSDHDIPAIKWKGMHIGFVFSCCSLH